MVGKEKNNRTGVPIERETIEDIKYIQEEWKKSDKFYGARMTQPNVIRILARQEVEKIKKEKEENENEKN